MTLNTASLIEVAYDDRQRLVRLVKGQALFEVAKHQARPFVVAAGDRRITATGTAFDVRLDRDQVKVLLIEGRVVVAAATGAGPTNLLPTDRQVLEPGEALVAGPSRAVSIAAADIERDTAWNRGQLVFRDERLADAVAEMNRYAPETLVIEDARIADLRISGVFGTARPETSRRS
ncbi:FecR family protein [Caulobacter segnis]